MTRDDIHATTEIPKDVRSFLKRVGGKNPYEESNYRLCLAEDRYMKIAGVFVEWPENTSIADRGGMIKQTVDLAKPQAIYASVNGEIKCVGWRDTQEVMMPSEVKPLRTYTGIKEVRRYPEYEGFILERWYPANMWGTPEEWNEAKLGDGTPMNGPYPERGEYLAVVGPWGKTPSQSVLQKAIQYVENGIQNRRYSGETMRRIRLNKARDEMERQSLAYIDWMAKYIIDKTSYLASTSLAGGRLRQAAADRVGLKGHFGN